MAELLTFPCVCVAVALVIALCLLRFRPGLEAWRIVLFASSPLPTIVILFCAAVFIESADTPHERCGVDACAMAMAGTVFFGAAAIGGWLLNAVATVLLVHVVRR